MRVLIIGQCQGGNAKTWQDFLSAYSEFELIHYVCRNQCQDDFFLKGEGKKVFRFYNRFQGMGLLRKIWVKLVSTRLLPAFVKRMDQKYHYDIIHFQGNYEPEFNLKLMNATKAKAVVSIYGSDFYQRYLNAGASGRKSFEKVIERAAHILFNFEMTRTDFLKEIDVKDKSSVGCMGVSDFWEEPVAKSTGLPTGVTRLLSARGMYAYNNVDLLVDAFIELYANNPSYELYLINGYGWDEPVKNAILEKVKGIENINAIVGRWITDEELKGYYALCDYNFCIGNTDQLSVSIIYGFMQKAINILSPLDNYKELDQLNFRTHHFLSEVTTEVLKETLANLPKLTEEDMVKDRDLARESFLFSSRFRNTKDVFSSLSNEKQGLRENNTQGQMTELMLEFVSQSQIYLKNKYRNGLTQISGHNGPYKDKETGVRAQAHFIVLLSNLDRAKQVKENEELVNKLIGDLLDSEYRLSNIVFNQRTKPGKDEVNGVIGIAWIMEAMCCAYQVYKHAKAKVFLENAEGDLRFDKSRKLWYRPVLKDSKYYNTIDETFNHQLWLAYALVYKSAVLDQPLSDNTTAFFRNLKSLLHVHSSGLIKHGIVNVSTPALRVRHILKTAKDSLNAVLKGKSFKYKEYGYHLFNMYAFARIVDLGYESLLSDIPAFKKASKFSAGRKLYDELTTNRDSSDFYLRGKDSGMKYNRYGLPYNVAGFEFLYVNKVLKLSADQNFVDDYFTAQLECYGIQQGSEKRGEYITEDISNLMLRSYELSFLMI